MALATANGSTGNNTGGTATATTIARDTSANKGSGFVVGYIYDSARTLNASSLTDSAGNVYTQIGTTITDATAALRTGFYRCLRGVGASSHSITGTLDANGFISVVWCEITATGGGGLILEGTASQANDTATPFTPGNISTAAGEALLISFLGGNSATTPATHAESTGFTIITNANFTSGGTCWPAVLGSRAVAPGTYNPSWTEASGTRVGVYVAGFIEGGSSSAKRPVINPKKGPKVQRFRPAVRAYSIPAANPNLSVDIDIPGALTLAGQASQTQTINVPIQNGALTLAGQAAQVQTINVPIQAGVLTLAGQTVQATIDVPIQNGLLTLAGQTVNSAIGLNVPIDTAGSITLNGQAVQASINVPINNGLITFAGQTIDSQISGGDLSVTIDVAGQLTITGQSITSQITGDSPPLGGLGPYMPMGPSTRYIKPKKVKKPKAVEIVQIETIPAPVVPEPEPIVLKLDTNDLKADVEALKAAIKDANVADQEAIEALIILLSL